MNTVALYRILKGLNILASDFYLHIEKVESEAAKQVANRKSASGYFLTKAA